MNTRLRTIIHCAWTAFVIGTFLWFNSIGVHASEASPSLFQVFHLKYGITIKLPKHWQILESQLMRQIDTNTELATGVAQGDNEIVIASNFYNGRVTKPSATARVSVRIKESLSQSALEAMTQEDLNIIGQQGYQVAVSALDKSGDSITKITPYVMTKDKVAGFWATRSDYQEITPSMTRNVTLYVISLGDRNVKLALSYDSTQSVILRATINEIKNTFQIVDASNIASDQSKQTGQLTQPAHAETREVIAGKEHHFSWIIPHSWEKTKPLTGAQYALQVSGSRGAFNCSLLVSAKKFELGQLLKEPRSYYDNAVLPNFPDSKFIRSSTTKLGTQDALITECIYTTKTSEGTASFAALTLCTVWKDHFYIMTFECSPKDIEFGRGLFKHIILGFSFL